MTTVGPGWAENNQEAFGFISKLCFLLISLFRQKVKSLMRENALRTAVGDRGKHQGAQSMVTEEVLATVNFAADHYSFL